MFNAATTVFLDNIEVAEFVRHPSKPSVEVMLFEEDCSTFRPQSVAAFDRAVFATLERGVARVAENVPPDVDLFAVVSYGSRAAFVRDAENVRLAEAY